MGVRPAATSLAADARLINREITEVLHTLVAERDWELARHQRGVARLARRVAPGLNLGEGESAALVEAAYLHDIGMVDMTPIGRRTHPVYAAHAAFWPDVDPLVNHLLAPGHGQFACVVVHLAYPQMR